MKNHKIPIPGILDFLGFGFGIFRGVKSQIPGTWYDYLMVNNSFGEIKFNGESWSLTVPFNKIHRFKQFSIINPKKITPKEMNLIWASMG